MIDLQILAAELRLTTLIEVHEMDSLFRVRSTIGFPLRSYSLLGINNRDLRTFKVDLETALRLADSIPSDVLTVAESGIESGADIGRLRSSGYDAFLVGERLMKAKSPAEALKSLLAEATSFLPTTNNQEPTTVL